MMIRSVEEKDNPELALLIREVLKEFGVARPGTAYTDPTTDNLYALFRTPASAYWVATDNGTVIGGCGVYPTDGLPEGCGELVKFYVAAAFRGRGIGSMLMEKSFESARSLGYRKLYLESMPELGKALGIYEKAGFRILPEPLGNSGHFGCKIWMLKDL